MIDQELGPRKKANATLGSGSVLFLLVALVTILSGCGGAADEQETAMKAEPGTEPTAACDVVIDTSLWDVFDGFCKEYDEGREVSRDELSAFTALPALDEWKKSMTARVPNIRLINWLDEAFHPDRPGANRKPSKDRSIFARNYRYSWKHRLEIEELLADFRDEDWACKLLDNISFWLPEEQRPKNLHIVFLPSKAEIRVHEDYLFIDTAVVRAGNNEQLSRQMAGLIFRDRAFLEGPVASGLEGDLAVAHSVRMMMNEGIGALVERQIETVFKSDHHRLGKFNIIPEQYFSQGQRAITMFNTFVPQLDNADSPKRIGGKDLARSLVASGSLHQGGYCMAACIEKNLGREELRDTIGSPEAFLRAYQQAATMNPVPAPDPYLVADDITTSMPPFAPEVFAELIKICEVVFPNS